MPNLREEHPQYFRVESRYNQKLKSKDAWEFLLATNSTHVLIHYFAQYMYARPDAHFGSKDGFSKQTLNWLNLILYFCVLIFVLVIMLLVPIVCLGLGVYGHIARSSLDETFNLSNIQLIVVGVVASIEFIARVVWYLIGRLDTKDSVFTFLESFDFLPIPIVGLFVWGIVEAIDIPISSYLAAGVNVSLLLNVIGIIGWGFYVLFRLQKFAIHIFDV